MIKHKIKVILLIITSFWLASCAGNKMKEIPLVKQVDIAKFMGNWYVIAAIPTTIETQSYNAIENYKLNDDGTIATTFTFYKGAFDGSFKTYQPKGFVKPDSGNALWGMQFIWPIKAEYRIVYLDLQYQRTIIARNARDYVWIMARTPQISDTEYKEMTDLITSYGYDISKLRKVPQQWPAKAKLSTNNSTE
jgi:apolipoprotein D and lipocalin family protein